MFVLLVCTSGNWFRWVAECNKKCDLLIGCRKMSKLCVCVCVSVEGVDVRGGTGTKCLPLFL